MFGAGKVVRQLSENGFEKIKQWEGLRLDAYQDQGGVWTIGYGHTGVDVKAGMKITKDKAERLLVDDVKNKAITPIYKALPDYVIQRLTQNQYDALVSFVFNVGGAAFARSTMCKKIKDGDLDGALAEFPRWNKIKGKVNKGLVNRRRAEMDLWTTGQVTGAFVASNYVAPTAPLPQGAVSAPATGAAVGVVTLAEPASKIIDTLQTQQVALSSGDKVQIAIGAIVVLAGVIGLITAWVKAGKPSPWKK